MLIFFNTVSASNTYIRFPLSAARCPLSATRCPLPAAQLHAIFRPLSAVRSLRRFCPLALGGLRQAAFAAFAWALARTVFVGQIILASCASIFVYMIYYITLHI
jgi:hypothetical protein